MTATNGNDLLFGTEEGDIIDGLAGDDTIYGSGGKDRLFGNEGNDSIYGDGGDDIISGGAGEDTLDGGDDNDFLDYSDSDAGVTINLQTNFASGGHAEGDEFSNFERIKGSIFDDILTGDKGNNIIIGGAGADILDGGDDRDWLDYRDSDAGVNINLEANTANGGHAEGDTIKNFESIKGSNFDDSLTGDSGNNRLEGIDGNDSIYGQGGDDIINGGTGADTLDGGDGIDVLDYRGSDAGININLDVNTASGGHAEGDTINNFENILGSKFDDVLIGNSSNNGLRGGGGNDIINGQGGDDRIIGDAGADTLDGGDGIDELPYGNSDAAVNVNLQTNTASGGHGEGDIISNIENITGSDFADVLTGDSAHNILKGGNGDDSLNGGSCNDSLNGGNGDDTLNGYGYTNEYDTLTGGEGADTFVLGDATFLNDGTVYYGEAAGFGVARITDFDWLEGDKFQVFGDLADYSLSYGDRHGSGAEDTFIEYKGDIIAVVQDTTTVVIDLDFCFV